MNDMKLKQLYDEACRIESDIFEHLPTLHFLARWLDVVEFGVRDGLSTLAFLAGGARSVTSYECNTPRPSGVPVSDRWTFVPQNCLAVEIPECDLLFIDTLHVYGQLKLELELHARNVRRYIAIHDTEEFGLESRDQDRDQFEKWISQYDDELADKYRRSPDGILYAIEEFLEGDEWIEAARYRNNNGLMILERV